MVNSNQKGKRGEREFARYLRSKGVPARRGQQFKGGGDSPDVVHIIEGVHFEVKRVERFQLHDAMAQAKAERATPEDVPVVAYRRSRGEWIAVLPMDDLIQLLKQRKIN